MHPKEPIDQDEQHLINLHETDSLASTMLEYLFSQESTLEEKSKEIKELTRGWEKEHVFMFWYQFRKHLNQNLRLILHALPKYGLDKRPEDLIDLLKNDSKDLKCGGSALTNEFAKMSEFRLRYEIELAIAEGRLSEIFDLQQKMMFRICAISSGKYLEDHKQSAPRLDKSNPVSLEHNLAMFELLQGYKGLIDNALQFQE